VGWNRQAVVARFIAVCDVSAGGVMWWRRYLLSGSW
jgi:hypothetical protein